MIDNLLLLSGNDIPFASARIAIHQPMLKEIAYIGQEQFLIGCDLLNFSIDSLKQEDKISLANKSNFEVFMSIMKENEVNAASKNKVAALMVLSLMFPKYRIVIESDKIKFSAEDEEPHYLNEKNFKEFQNILIKMFCLDKFSKSKESYKPGNKRAEEIANKLRKGRERAAAAKGQSDSLSLFDRYVSILSIAQQSNINSLLSYTVFQLFDQFDRFELKYAWDLNIQQRLAGAKDVEEVDNWMKNIH